MPVQRLILLVSIVLVAGACAFNTGGGPPQVRSKGGTVAHGELVTVPWGTVEDWNIIVTPMQMGAEEPGSEDDNRLLRFRAFPTVQDETTWQITALYRFAYAAGPTNVHWVEGSAHYLMVPK